MATVCRKLERGFGQCSCENCDLVGTVSVDGHLLLVGGDCPCLIASSLNSDAPSPFQDETAIGVETNGLTDRDFVLLALCKSRSYREKVNSISGSREVRLSHSSLNDGSGNSSSS
jgi:hypothetical protein